RRQDEVFQLIGKIRGVKERKGRAAEHVSLLRLFQFRADEGGTFQAYLHRRMTARLQPVHQPGNLGGTTGTVCAFHHEQPASQVLRLDVRDAMAIKTAALFWIKILHAGLSSSVSFASGTLCRAGGSGRG